MAGPAVQMKVGYQGFYHATEFVVGTLLRCHRNEAINPFGAVDRYRVIPSTKNFCMLSRDNILGPKKHLFVQFFSWTHSCELDLYVFLNFET
jgi:hypothetical protein